MRLCLIVIVLVNVGCAGTRILTPQIGPDIHTSSLVRMEQPIPNSRVTPENERTAVVNGIDKRVNEAAIRVCQRSFTNPGPCREILQKRTLVVKFDDGRINASVGEKYDLTVLGGLVAYAGSDDEIAAVLAHEYSHAMLGHPSKSAANTGLGLLAGIVAGTYVGVKTETPEFVELGAQIGYGVGTLVFSKSMELAADHFGMFIMHEAGYDIRAAAQFHIRMMKLEAEGATSDEKGLLGYLHTHPSPERRIQKLIATEEMIFSGDRAPSWKSAGVARDGWTPLHAAAARGNTAAVHKLLASGADPNTKADKRTSLHLAAERGHMEVVRLLLDGGADPNINKGRHHPGRSPLYLAVEQRYPDIVRLLLEYGAKPDAWIRIGITGARSPLQVAVDLNDSTITRLLVDHGAKYDTWIYSAYYKDAVRRLLRESTDRNTHVNNPSTPRSPLTHKETDEAITAEPVAKKAAETATAAGTAAVVKPPTTTVPESPSLTPAETDANLIERARRIVLAYTENLPNFVCTKISRSGWLKDGARSRWRQSREVTAEVQFVDGRESYRNVTMNGRRSKKNFRDIAGYGEFGSTLYDLFRPEAGAVFTRSGDDVIGGREVAVFRMEVVNPSYGIHFSSWGRNKRPINVGFRGLVSIDKATGHVLRHDAREMLGVPSDYLFRQASHSIDYDYVPIGGKPHLLPVRSRWAYRYPKKFEIEYIEWTSCRKFGAESTVDFE